MVQAWYQGGLSVFDFTDSAHPVEIAFFDRGPLDAKQLITGGYWSTYWYNGNIYGAEIARGLDVFRLKTSEYLSANELAAAVLVQATSFNAQQQARITWPSDSVVARAYIDQLNRTKGIGAARAGAVTSALERADRVKNTRSREAETSLDELTSLSAQVDADARAASGRDAIRLHALATTLTARAARFHAGA